MQYTCPMHLEVIRDKPGSCPICGMALEKKLVALEAGSSEELIEMSWRFWLGVVLSMPIILLTMGAHKFFLNYKIVIVAYYTDVSVFEALAVEAIALTDSVVFGTLSTGRALVDDAVESTRFFF